MDYLLFFILLPLGSALIILLSIVVLEIILFVKEKVKYLVDLYEQR